MHAAGKTYTQDLANKERRATGHPERGPTGLEGGAIQGPGNFADEGPSDRTAPPSHAALGEEAPPAQSVGELMRAVVALTLAGLQDQAPRLARNRKGAAS
jgi:hypothetical protein